MKNVQHPIEAVVPAFRSLWAVAIGGTGAVAAPSPIVKPVALDIGNVLRIRDGRGLRIVAASGVLWITEEGSVEDHVLWPGDAIELTRPGTAIVLAHRPARVVLEVPVGVAPPRRLEMALADGEPGTRMTLAAPSPRSLETIAAGIAAVFQSAGA